MISFKKRTLHLITIFIFLRLNQILGENQTNAENTTRAPNYSEDVEKANAMKNQLMTAIHGGDIRAIKHLIKAGVLTSLLPGYEERMSTLGDKLDTLQLLLVQGIVKVQDNFNQSGENPGVFNVSLVNGSDLVMSLQVNSTVIRNWTDAHVVGRTPLHIICAMPDVTVDAVKHFIDSGANINAQTDGNITALQIAAEGGNLELVKLLHENGAKINVSVTVKLPSDGNNIMKIFVRNKELLANDLEFKTTPLTAAIQNGHNAVVQYLLSQEADVNYGGSMTPLQTAVLTGREDITELLLANGAEIDGRDSRGQTALHKAAYAGIVDMAQLLVFSGANPNITDEYGWTPFHWAALCVRDPSMMNFFIGVGIDVNAKTDDGFSLLNLAVAGGHSEFLQFLVDRLQTLNTTKEFTDLKEENMEQKNKEVIASLLNQGASPDIQDDLLGWSALHWAVATGDVDVVGLLVSFGANTILRSKLGLTPLDMARNWGRRNVYNYLKGITKAR